MSHTKRRISRREFLTVAGVGMAALASGCKMGQKGGLPTGMTSQEILYQYTLPAAPQGEPELILRNGKVYTVDATYSMAQAVAVKNGLIQAVGSNESIDALKGASTQVVELNGRVLTPGLIDSHIHIALLFLMEDMIAFVPPEVNTIPKLLEKLKQVVAETPPGEWVQAYFITLEEKRMPTRHELDTVSPDNPVWFMQLGGHFGCANTKALELAGITKDTQSPPGGIIEKDASGDLTGGFYNHRAMNVLRKALPPRPEGAVKRSIINGQSQLVSFGATTFHDVWFYGKDIFDAYLETAREGSMIMGGAIYPVLENPGELDTVLAYERYKDDFLRLGGFKLQIDGSALTAYCHEPHSGTAWDKPAWPEDIYKKTVKALHDAGNQICVHCVGDAAVDLTLDAFEEAMDANPRTDPRHRIEHCVLTKPKSTQRIKDLGVIVSYTPGFLRMYGDFYVEIFGRERGDRIMVGHEWLEAGIAMALGSDYPTTPWIKAQSMMACTIGRKTSSEQVLNASQRITFDEALRAQTMGSAYAAFEESTKGSIEPGKRADLAVWTSDPSQMDLKGLFDATIDMTYVGGKQVYPAS